jgi:hypothetical protein
MWVSVTFKAQLQGTISPWPSPSAAVPHAHPEHHSAFIVDNNLQADAAKEGKVAYLHKQLLEADQRNDWEAVFDISSKCANLLLAKAKGAIEGWRWSRG